MSFFEQVIRNTGVRGGNVSTLNLPLESIVAPGALDRLMRVIKSDMKVELEVVRVHGRVVVLRNKLGNRLPPWYAFAEWLLGDDMCQDYQVDKGDGKKPDLLYVKMMTAAQVEALQTAEDLDTLFNAQLDQWGDPAISYCVTCRGDISNLEGTEFEGEAPKTPAKRKKKLPEGAAVFVMKVMERDYQAGTVEIDDLVAKVVPTVPPKVDAEGKNRTARYVRAAVDKLVGLELLYLHNGTQVSLTALEQGNGSF